MPILTGSNILYLKLKKDYVFENETYEQMIIEHSYDDFFKKDNEAVFYLNMSGHSAVKLMAIYYEIKNTGIYLEDNKFLMDFNLDYFKVLNKEDIMFFLKNNYSEEIILLSTEHADRLRHEQMLEELHLFNKLNKIKNTQ